MSVFLITSAAALIVPGIWLLKLLGIRSEDTIEAVSKAYILSMAIMFGLLYLGGITSTFSLVCVLHFILVLTGFVHLSYRALEIYRREGFDSVLRLIPKSPPKQMLVFATAALAILCSAYLMFRIIMDSDVIQFYLPFAREIASQNGFSYTTGYDYNVFLKPIAVSVMYAWTFVIGGSLQTELFRLMPLIPVVLLPLITYGIAKDALGSRRLALIASFVVVLSPIYDRILLYNAFYPDMFYYPLVLASIFLLLRFTKSGKSQYLIWLGLALGSASLLKAQTIYFMIISLFFVLLVSSPSRTLSAVLSFSMPFSILLPNVVADSIQGGVLVSMPPGFGIAQLGLFTALGALAMVIYVYVSGQSQSLEGHYSAGLFGHRQLASYSVIDIAPSRSMAGETLQFAKRVAYVLAPFLALSGLWYVSNFMRFGSFLNTSSVGLPDYEWAELVLESIAGSTMNAGSGEYLVFFGFMFLDPAVMGFVWLIPMVTGFIFFARSRMKTMHPLLLISSFMAILVFAQVVFRIPIEGTPVYNPRDLIFLLPLEAVLISLGACWLVGRMTACHLPSQIPTKYVIALITYFGIFSYLHSPLVYFASYRFPTSIVSRVFQYLASIAGLQLNQTSFQLLPDSRISFPLDNLMSILGLAVLVSLPVVLLVSFQLIRTRLKDSSVRKGPIGFESILKGVGRFRKMLSGNLSWYVLLVVVAGIILLPRAEIGLNQFLTQDGHESQMAHLFNGLEVLWSENRSPLEGNILTFQSPMGMPYFLPNSAVVDLKYPANLAHLRDILTNPSPYVAVLGLRDLGFRYLLFTDEGFGQMDEALNGTFSSIRDDEELLLLEGTYGQWSLFEMGPFVVHSHQIPLASWFLDERFTNSDYYYQSNSSALTVGLNATDLESRVSMASYFTGFDLRDYRYVIVELNGTGNSLVFLRFYLDDDQAVDVAYWEEPSILSGRRLILNGHSESRLRGDVYLGLKSSDGEPAGILVSSIRFFRAMRVTNTTRVALTGWSVDARYTNASSYQLRSESSLLRFEMNPLDENSRLAAMSYDLSVESLACFKYVYIWGEATSNTIIFFRVFFLDGSSFDIVYWLPAQQALHTLITLPDNGERIFRGDAYISIMSYDGNRSVLSLDRISFFA